ncbi:MAG: hypothetical protein J6S67_23390 [Methanobrevibacter sp.]|nr:hypothetical protein [Methanobrevibacter sp.]
MARTIAPGQPTPITAPNVNIPDIDLSIFDKYGDEKIKSATRNFQLYATTTANAESQKLYQKYKNNPIALANALSKLPEMFNELPASVRDELKPKLDANSISLVTKAQANQQATINKQNKILANANAKLNMDQISEDYFNVLRYITSPEEEKRPVDLAIYRAHRAELTNLMGITDDNGNPLFNETLRAKMAMPKEATVAGFKNFINRMEADQLKDWDKTIFQNKDKFMEDTSIDSDTYESMETAITKRIKALEDTSTRTIHGQAYYDQINLITEPTTVNIEKAKSYDFTDNKAIDKLVEASKKTTLAKYYDPTRKTSPNAFVQAYNVFSEMLENISDNPSPEEQTKLIAAAAEANERLVAVAEASNLAPGYTDRIKTSIATALANTAARQALVDADFANRTRSQRIVEAAKKPIFNKRNPNEPILKQYQTEAKDEAIADLYQSQEEKALALATKRYNDDMSYAMGIYLTGNMDAFRQACAEADRRFDMNRAGFIVKSNNEWQRLQNALANKQPALIQYMGRTLEFKGFDNKGAVFVEKN